MRSIDKLFWTLSAITISISANLVPQYTQHYHLSIFDHLPIYLIYFAAMVIVASYLYFTYDVIMPDQKPSVAIISPIISVFISLIFLPYLLGYVTRYGDIITHAGLVDRVAASGRMPGSIYPAMYNLGGSLSLISDLPGNLSIAVLSGLSWVSFVVVLALIARISSVPPAYVLIFTPLTLFSGLTTSMFTYMTIFLFSLLIVHIFMTQNLSNSHRWIAIMVIFSWIWAFHVVPSTVFLLVIGIYILGSQINSVSRVFISPGKERKLVSIVLIIIFTGYLWWTHTWLFHRAVFLSLSVFGKNTVQPGNLNAGMVLSALFTDFNYSLIDLGFLVLKRLGDQMVLLSLSATGVALFILRARREQIIKESVPLFVAVIVPFASFWSIIEALVDVVPSLSFFRTLRPALFVGGIGGGYLIHSIANRDEPKFNHEKIRRGLITVFVFLVLAGSLISAANTYPSPWTLGKNGYVMDSDIEGMDWYYDYKEKSTNTSTLWRSNDRFMDYLMSKSEKEHRAQELNYGLPTNQYRMPPRLGYANHSYISEAIGCRYYIESTYGKSIVTGVWDELEPYQQSDFKRKQSDPTLNTIYTNNNVNVAITHQCLKANPTD